MGDAFQGLAITAWILLLSSVLTVFAFSPDARKRDQATATSKSLSKPSNQTMQRTANRPMPSFHCYANVTAGSRAR